MRECMKGSQIMLDVEGKEYDVLIKEMDYDSMKRSIVEMDFQALVKGEKVHSVAEIVLITRIKSLREPWNNSLRKYLTRQHQSIW